VGIGKNILFAWLLETICVVVLIKDIQRFIRAFDFFSDTAKGWWAE